MSPPRTTHADGRPPARRTVLAITGSRAEFGLLRPVFHAIDTHTKLTLRVVAAGSHLLPPARSVREVAREFPIVARVPMQRSSPSDRTRTGDALAVSRGIAGFAGAIAKHRPDWVLVLGDRIEAFAAASAASIGGVRVAHIHGGDRAEGIADEAMRHAISKLAHLHLAATETSAARLILMGENESSVINTGSPAIDGLRAIPHLDRRELTTLGAPSSVVLLHPSGLSPREERTVASSIVDALDRERAGPVLCLAPNHDAGRDLIASILRARCARPARAGEPAWTWREHLPRETFVALLKHLARARGLLIGNSSAGLIEARALGVRIINVGPRQQGRETGPHAIDVPLDRLDTLAAALRRARAMNMPAKPDHPFGDGRAGERIAGALASAWPSLRKHNSY